MSSPLRSFAYRHRWFYNAITALSGLSVGGVERLRRLGLNSLRSKLPQGAKVLDLCCGAGEAAAAWIDAGFEVTGLDMSPKALELAAKQQPQLRTVEGMAENPPLESHQFDAIQLSLALHEFNANERQLVLENCLRLLKPAGWLVLVDLHPAGPWLKLPQDLFCALFETETATEMLQADLPKQLQKLGFGSIKQELFAAGALQRISAQFPNTMITPIEPKN